MIPIIGPILEIVEKLIPDQDKKLELEKELLKNKSKIEEHFSEYAKQDHAIRLKEFEHKGFKSWWRPAAMFALTVIMTAYLFLFYILPQIIVVFGLNVYYLEPIEMPEVVWYSYTASMLGLGALRSIYDKRK